MAEHRIKNAEVAAHIRRAWDMVHALCRPRGSEGSREWLMSIPARPDRDPDLIITRALQAATDEINRLQALVSATPVDQWKIVKDQPVLIFVVHEHAKYAESSVELPRWQGWCVGFWTDFNKGGWVWHGHLGTVTHVAPLLPDPAVSR